MHRLTWLVAACVGLAGVALAAASSEQTVQGIYEGAWKDAKGSHKIEARVVACGKQAYQVFVREVLQDKTVAKAEMEGKTEGEKIAFAGGDWSAEYAGGAIVGKCGDGGTFELQRTLRQSPTLGAKVPAGAVVLLDGKNFDEVVKKPLKDGKEQEWTLVEGGAIQMPKGGLNSKQQFAGSFKLHVEFNIPFMPDGRGQGRGNSGVCLPNGEEIQVLDSFGMTTYEGGGCGGLYKYKDPDAFDKFSLASLPPLQWQTYDIEYHVQTKDGKVAGKPRVTVLHNGIKIHDNAELQKDAKSGTFHFQDHGNPVQYRNLWVLPLKE